MITQGSTVGVNFIKETVIGTTPATPQTISIPYVSCDLEMTKEVFTDPSRTADNQKRFLTHGAYTVGGPLKVALSHGQFDDLLAGALMGSWTANVCKIANTKSGFTIEEFDAQQSPAIGRVFTGCEIDSLSVSITPSDLVTADFGIKGRTMALTTALLDSTPTAIQAKTPFSHVGGFIKIDNAVVYTTAVSFTVNNNISQVQTLSSNAVYGTSVGQKQVQGQITALFEDVALYNKFINNSAASFEVQLTDGTNTLTFKMPNIKSTSANAAAKDAGARFITFDFEALYDTTLASIMSITRS